MSNVTYTVQVTIDNSEGKYETEASAYVMFGDMPEMGEKPDKGDAPQTGERPDEGDAPQTGEKPDEGDAPQTGNNSDEGDASQADTSDKSKSTEKAGGEVNE